jgi:hypothetical protein
MVTGNCHSSLLHPIPHPIFIEFSILLPFSHFLVFYFESSKMAGTLEVGS